MTMPMKMNACQTRIKFLRRSLLSTIAHGLHAGVCAVIALSVFARESKAENVVPNQPSVTFPVVAGERYELTVPDTLDLAERIQLSLNALTRCVDGPPAHPFPDTQIRSQHFIILNSEGPKAFRSIPLYGKSMLASRLARLVTGDDERIDVDNDWRKGFIDFQQVDPVLHGPGGGRWLEWIAFNIRCEQGSDRAAWQRIAAQAVDRLSKAAVPIDDEAWLLVGDDPGDDGFDNAQQAKSAAAKHLANELASLKGQPPQGWLATFNSWTIQGLTALYRETHDEAALKLAGRLAHFMKDHGEVLAPDGTFLAGHEHEWPVVHWHHSFLAAVACAEYGAASGDAEILEFANTAYQVPSS